MTLRTDPVQGGVVQLGVETGHQAVGAQPPPRGPALGPSPRTRFPKGTHQLPALTEGPSFPALKRPAVSQARTGTHGGWHPCSSDTVVRVPPLATLSWALGSPPSTRYLPIRASWLSAAAFRSISRSTDSGLRLGRLQGETKSLSQTAVFTSLAKQLPRAS